MVGEACLPSNAYYPRTPDYALYSGVHVCWSEHSDSPFVCGFFEFGVWLSYHDRNYLQSNVVSFEFSALAPGLYTCIKFVSLTIFSLKQLEQFPPDFTWGLLSKGF